MNAQAKSKLNAVATMGEYVWSLVYHFGDPDYGWDADSTPGDLIESLEDYARRMGTLAREALAVDEEDGDGDTTKENNAPAQSALRLIRE